MSFDMPEEQNPYVEELEDMFQRVMQTSAAANRGYSSAKSYGLEEPECLKAAIVQLEAVNAILRDRVEDYFRREQLKSRNIPVSEILLRSSNLPAEPKPTTDVAVWKALWESLRWSAVNPPLQQPPTPELTAYEYVEGQFRDEFVSPFEQYAQYRGRRFEVVRAIPAEEATPDFDDPVPMYVIRFENGTQINAWSEEVCVPAEGSITPEWWKRPPVGLEEEED